MIFEADTKVILLPKGYGAEPTYKILKLPLDKKGTRVKSFLLSDNQLFELVEVKGFNAFSNKRAILLKNGTSVKSFLFEGGEHSSILQSPNVLVASKFNLVYLLILIMHQNESFSKRYITMEDFIDSMSEFLDENSWINEISKELYETALKNICDSIHENNEDFFKFSIEKTIEFLTKKVNELKEYIQNKPNSIKLKIESELLDPTSAESTTPENILHLSILKHALYLICNSYISEEVIEEITKVNKYSFIELDNYVKDMNSKKKEMEVVQSGMNEIASASSKIRNKKKVEEKKKVTKKVVKKVAIGKGALDGFFKKA